MAATLLQLLCPLHGAPLVQQQGINQVSVKVVGSSIMTPLFM
jgi:hypothetical protein